MCWRAPQPPGLRCATMCVLHCVRSAGRSCDFTQLTTNQACRNTKAMVAGKAWNTHHSFDQIRAACEADAACVGFMWYNNQGGSYTGGGKVQMCTSLDQQSRNYDFNVIKATCACNCGNLALGSPSPALATPSLGRNCVAICFVARPTQAAAKSNNQSTIPRVCSLLH